MASVAFMGVFRLQEPLVERVKTRLWLAFTAYGRLLCNQRYLVLVVIFSITGLPVFAFIAGSSDLYITRLGYDEQAFGYFFGLNAMAFILAPFLFSRLVHKVTVSRMIPLAFIGMLVGAALFFYTPMAMPYRLAIRMFTVTFSFAFCRPAGNNLILEQVDRDAGAASSLMVFCYFISGSLAMWFFSLAWVDKVTILALMAIVPVVLALILWRVSCGFVREQELDALPGE
jgi:DHA1 family bicyclomycin/chloramphenicol resistance-like MFS transporter